MRALQIICMYPSWPVARPAAHHLSLPLFCRSSPDPHPRRRRPVASSHPRRLPSPDCASPLFPSLAGVHPNLQMEEDEEMRGAAGKEEMPGTAGTEEEIQGWRGRRRRCRRRRRWRRRRCRMERRRRIRRAPRSPRSCSSNLI